VNCHLPNLWNVESEVQPQLFALASPWIHFWYMLVVKEYAQMYISVPGDKLISFSGIARYAMPRMSSRYIASMR
jgi:hypothetical protein